MFCIQPIKRFCLCLISNCHDGIARFAFLIAVSGLDAVDVFIKVATNVDDAKWAAFLSEMFDFCPFRVAPIPLPSKYGC